MTVDPMIYADQELRLMGGADDDEVGEEIREPVLNALSHLLGLVDPVVVRLAATLLRAFVEATLGGPVTADEPWGGLGGLRYCRRVPSVTMQDGRVYDSRAVVWEDPEIGLYLSSDSRKEVILPYDPLSREVVRRPIKAAARAVP